MCSVCRHREHRNNSLRPMRRRRLVVRPQQGKALVQVWGINHARQVPSQPQVSDHCVNQPSGLLPSRGRRFTPSVVTGNKRLTRLFPGEWPVIRPRCLMVSRLVDDNRRQEGIYNVFRSNCDLYKLRQPGLPQLCFQDQNFFNRLPGLRAGNGETDTHREKKAIVHNFGAL